MPAKVLDAYALMAFFEDESGGKEVGELIKKASIGQLNLLMSVVNLGEVWYSVAREYSEAAAAHCLQTVEGLPIQIVDVDWELAHQAARFKTAGKIAYADCFAAALAKNRNAELVTGDPEFKRLEGDLKISWL